MQASSVRWNCIASRLTAILAVMPRTPDQRLGLGITALRSIQIGKNDQANAEVGVIWTEHSLGDCQVALIVPRGFGKPALGGIKHTEAVEHMADIGMKRPKRLFQYGQRA